MRSLLKILKLQEFENLSARLWKDFEELNLSPKQLVRPYYGHYPIEQIKEILTDIHSCNPGWYSE